MVPSKRTHFQVLPLLQLGAAAVSSPYKLGLWYRPVLLPSVLLEPSPGGHLPDILGSVELSS